MDDDVDYITLELITNMYPSLEGLKACVLAAEGAEDLEFYVTLMRLQEEGVAVDTVALSMDSFAGKNGLKSDSVRRFDFW